jgi:large subunit ribosomal protein L15
MQSNTLKRVHADMTSARVGRGGTRGKTSGRGTKGQNARAGHKKRPEMRDLIKKLPKLRGHGKNRARTVRTDRITYAPINLSLLDAVFTSGDTITVKTLVAKGIVEAQNGHFPHVKILGSGTLTKKLSISGCEFSAAAKSAIEAAGGSILA